MKNKIRFDDSYGSYLNIDGENYLDFWSFFSSLPLGYNHPIFDDYFYEEIEQYVSQKFGMDHGLITDEEIAGKELLLKTAPEFDVVLLASSGSLAVETAYRVAKYATGATNALAGYSSFHGIHGLSNFFTAKPDKRLLFVDDPYVRHVNLNNPVLNMDRRLACVLIEPFQSLYNHYELNIENLKWFRRFCDLYDVPLIYDEIQTGFGATGKMWYYQKLGVVPDILIFGKKAQAAGMMVNKKYRWPVDEYPDRFSATFNGDIIDLIRMKYAYKAIQNENLLEKVNKQSAILKEEVEGMRGVGYLLGYPVSNAVHSMKRYFEEDKFLVNRVGDHLIKIRPNLALSEYEMEEAIAKMVKRS